ncbi:MAG: transglycosylase domain-containing protein, partial [Patescibacteria group bacterium]
MEPLSPFSKRILSDASVGKEARGSRLSIPWSRFWPMIISLRQGFGRQVGWIVRPRIPRSPNTRRWILRIGAGIFGVIVLYGAHILFTLPNVDDIGALVAAESTAITDRNGIELYRIHGDEDRTFVPLAKIADTLKQATVAIEDERFFTRGCFDPRAFLRAAFGNVLGGFGSQGGSTITQQFAKNALIGSRKKRITRKLREYILSCKLERRYTKEQILELYLNRIPYGYNVHGAEQAAQTYFAKSASGLTLAEAAVLAALPQLPSYLNPYEDHVRSTLSEEGVSRFAKGKIRDASDLREDDFWLGLVGSTVGSGSSVTGTRVYIGGRTDQVLRNMQDQGFITEEERRETLAELQGITFKRTRENIRAPHFIFAVREQLLTMFREQGEQEFLEQGGLRVTTTLDWKLQESAERIAREVGAMNMNLYGAYNVAVLVAKVQSGEILAYVGNRDYWDTASDGNVDVIRSPRQPGSSFKPFAYAAAFLRGFTPSTVLWDIPIEIGDDEPDNFDRTFWGPLTIRRALGASRNIPAAQSFVLAGGEETILDLAEQMGVTSIRKRKEELSRELGYEYEYGWPLALGAAEVPLVEMVQGYLTFARAGKSIPLVSILKVEDR